MIRRPRILVATFPNGGPRQWGEQLCTILKRDFDVTLVTGRFGYLRAMFSRPDVLHTAVPLPINFARATVLTIHGDFTQEKLLGRVIYPIAVRHANMVTCPSEYLSEQIGVITARIVPNGVQIPKDSKKDYRITQSQPVLGIITSFHFEKKSEGVLELSRITRDAAPESELLVAGSGPLLEKYQTIAKGINQNVRFLGNCDSQNFLDQIDIFVYYSHQDNVPLVVLEAMAKGLPIISNNVGGLSEVFSDAMSRYLTKTNVAYQAVLAELGQSEDERRNAGTIARARAEDFCWTKVAKKFINIYDSLPHFLRSD